MYNLHIKIVVTTTMNNTTLHISLPASLVESAKTRAEDEKFENMSDYMRSLIREDLRRMEEQKLEQMLLHSINSGSRELTPADWRKLKQEILESIKNKET
jgi:antitoxin ParD1/3/4